MKVQLFVAVLAVLCLSVYCKPARRYDGLRRSHRQTQDESNLQLDPAQQDLQPEESVQDAVPETPLDEPVPEVAVAKKPAKKNYPTYNYFPVMFAGSGYSGRSEGFPGGTVAIANSFSTGRRGVATSNANAFPDPAILRQLYRNENQQQAPQQY